MEPLEVHQTPLHWHFVASQHTSFMASASTAPKRKRAAVHITPGNSKRTKPSLTKHFYDYVKFVKIVAGQGELRRTFILHEEVICKRSPFVREELAKTTTKDDGDRVIELPDVMAAHFLAYTKNLYEEDSELHVSVSFELVSLESIDDPGRRLIFLISFWHIGQKMKDTVFMNKVLDSMISLMVDGIDTRELCHFADNADLIGPKLRKLTIDILSRRVTVEDTIWLITYWPDLAREVQEQMVHLRDSLTRCLPTHSEWQKKYRDASPLNEPDTPAA